MTRAAVLTILAALVSCTWTSSGRAQAGAASGEPARPERRPSDTREASLDVSVWTSFRIGVVDAPYPSRTVGEVASEAGQARLLRFGAAARVTENTWVGAHAAYVFGGVEEPAGSYRATSVWGNPILFGQLARPRFFSLAGAPLDADFSLSLGLPVAAERGRTYEQLDRRALALGDALEGMLNPEVFTPDVLPLAVGGTLVLPQKHFQFSLGLELPVLVRLSDDTIPDGASSSAIGVVPNGELRAAAWPWPWFGVSLGGSVAWPVAQPVYLSSRAADPQATLVPRVLFALGDAVLLALEVAIAAGGPASGTASAALSARLSL